MSDGRDGNFDIYRVDSTTDQVLRLTTAPAIDGLPAVSPDGGWVAFVSNRSGGWQLWAVPLAGGNATPIAPIAGNFDNWLGQDLQWIR
jgi:TolB protein